MSISAPFLTQVVDAQAPLAVAGVQEDPRSGTVTVVPFGAGRSGSRPPLPRMGPGDEPPKSLFVKAAVRLELVDAGDNTTGMNSAGKGFGRLPGAEIVVLDRGDGSFEWLAALPRGRIEVTITSMTDGSFQLVTKTAGHPIHEYPPVTLAKGVSATVLLDDDATPEPLRTADGGSLHPKEVEVVEGEPKTVGDPASRSDRTIAAERKQARPGQLVRIYVRLKNPGGVANMNYEIRYDPAVARPEGGLLAGNLLRGKAIFEANPNERGRIRIGFAGPDGLDQDGTVAVIPFRATGRPGASTALTLATPVIHDAQGRTLSITRVDGAIEIPGDSGPGGPGPGGPGPGPQKPEAPPLDCDGDEKLTTVDGDCALEMSVGKKPLELRADIDGDGEVTSGDARILIQRYRDQVRTRR